VKRRDLFKLFASAPAAWCVSKLGLEHLGGPKMCQSLAELEADGFRTSSLTAEQMIEIIRHELERLWYRGIDHGHIVECEFRMLPAAKIQDVKITMRF